MSGAAENISDEPPVVGEPASQPHQAAVVGEPPEEMGPVLGEPVPLANGLQQDKEPVSSSSPDESAINGVRKETSPFDEPSSDAPSSTHFNVGSTNPATATATDEHIMTEEASAEEGIRSATENLVQPEYITETSDARAYEVPNADIPEDAEVTHITDVPLEPPRPGSQALVENPFSVLDEGSAETDLNVSDELEEPGVTDVHDAAQEEAVSPAQDEDEGPSIVDSPEETKHTERPAAEEVNKAEAQGSVNNAVINEEDEKVQGDKKIEEKPAQPECSVNEKEMANTREAVLPEEVLNKKTPGKEGEGVDASVDTSPVEVEQDVNRETVSSDVDKIPSSEGEKLADSDSSLVHIDKNVTADAFPMESSGLRAIAAEADNVDQQPPSDETPLGENGFQHDRDGVPQEREKAPSKDEKPSSRFKLPMVFTTLAIAVVGVAVVSFGRSRQ